MTSRVCVKDRIRIVARDKATLISPTVMPRARGSVAAYHQSHVVCSSMDPSMSIEIIQDPDAKLDIVYPH